MDIKRFIVVAIGTFLLVTAFIAWVGRSANKEVEKIVTAQFNRQQLILAKEVANNIDHHLQFLGTGLLFLNQCWEADSSDPDVIRAVTNAHFRLLKGWDVLAAGRMERNGKIRIVLGEVLSLTGKELGIDPKPFWSWASSPENHEKVLFGRTFSPNTGPYAGRRLMPILTPKYRSGLYLKPDIANRFEGVSFLLADALEIAQRYARKIRSGQTGYAWVVDQDGIFLSHDDSNFVGQNFFTIRQKKNPRISWTRINELTKERLLRGEEGTDWYISGWHRGATGEMEKLFAYTPIFLSSQGKAGHLWSVAVVAPITEVYGAIQSPVQRQWLTMGAFQLVVFGFFSVAIYFVLHWSRILKTEVERKTADLSSSEEEVRKERDKVKQSMETLIKTQEALIRSERFAAIGEAAAKLSHEIKNPLMLIGGFAAQIKKSLAALDPNEKKLQMIISEVQRLEQLLTEVRDFTRPSNPQKEFANVNACIADILELMQTDLASRGIIWDEALDPNLQLVWFDPRQIKQVLINLLKNAAEAMPDGGRIIIASKENRGFVEVSVADSGSGIAPEAFQNIFSPFFTTKSKGTGLGLPVSYRIIKDHGGEIFFQSKKGEGTRFTFALPSSPDPATTSEDTRIEGKEK